jgi:hypothetical protein
MEPTNQGEVPKLSQVTQIDEGKIQEHLGEVVPAKTFGPPRGSRAPPGLCFNKCAKNSGHYHPGTDLPAHSLTRHSLVVIGFPLETRDFYSNLPILCRPIERSPFMGV